MTYEQLIEFAKQSGSDFTRSDHFVCTLHDFKRFADFVAAHEREAIIEILSRTEFTSLEHMPSEAALIIRMRGGA